MKTSIEETIHFVFAYKTRVSIHARFLVIRFLVTHIRNFLQLKHMIDNHQSDPERTLLLHGHISFWNTEEIENMSGLFRNNTSFNADISAWNVSNVKTMCRTFMNATSFNQPLNNWNVSNVVDMSGMFELASSFNQPLGKWNIANVQRMTHMFYGARSFHTTSHLSSWKRRLDHVQDTTHMFLFTTPL